MANEWLSSGYGAACREQHLLPGTTPRAGTKCCVDINVCTLAFCRCSKKNLQRDATVRDDHYRGTVEGQNIARAAQTQAPQFDAVVFSIPVSVKITPIDHYASFRNFPLPPFYSMLVACAVEWPAQINKRPFLPAKDSHGVQH